MDNVQQLEWNEMVRRREREQRGQCVYQDEPGS